MAALAVRANKWLQAMAQSQLTGFPHLLVLLTGASQVTTLFFQGVV